MIQIYFYDCNNTNDNLLESESRRSSEEHLAVSKYHSIRSAHYNNHNSSYDSEDSNASILSGSEVLSVSPNFHTNQNSDENIDDYVVSSSKVSNDSKLNKISQIWGTSVNIEDIERRFTRFFSSFL